MTTFMRIRTEDARVWRTATWASPFTVQAVLAAVVGISWLAGRFARSPHGLAQYAIGSVITLVLSIAIAVALLIRKSSRAQGIAISIVGSLAVALVGGTVYGFWVIGW